MGVDCYLQWKGQTEEEHQKQITGWSIDAGEFGYLRASYAMPEECKVLRYVFPECIWEPKDEKDKRLIFTKEKLDEVREIAETYKIFMLNKKPIPGKEKELAKMQENFHGIGLVMQKLGWSIINPNNEGNNGDVEIWADSLVKFFELGKKLEDEGKEPSVYINW